MLRRAIILASIGLVVTMGGVFLIDQMAASGPAPLSAHGWFAFFLGALFCLILSCGLFALVFFSARSGRDEVFDPTQKTDNQNFSRIS